MIVEEGNQEIKKQGCARLGVRTPVAVNVTEFSPPYTCKKGVNMAHQLSERWRVIWRAASVETNQTTHADQTHITDTTDDR
jgi:hypothetical protein